MLADEFILVDYSGILATGFTSLVVNILCAVQLLRQAEASSPREP